MTHTADVRLRTGFWRFGSVRARLALDDDGRISITSIDPATGAPNALIASSDVRRTTASAAGSVISFEMDGNRHRVDLGGRGWARRISEWRKLLGDAGLVVPYRSLHPALTAALTAVVGILVAQYVLALTFGLIGVILRSVFGVAP